jgi:hypothetical protein
VPRSERTRHLALAILAMSAILVMPAIRHPPRAAAAGLEPCTHGTARPEVDPMDALPLPALAPGPRSVLPGPGGEPLLGRLRGLVGREVALDTAGGTVEGMLLSCTARSAWVVAGDVDHVVALPHLLDVRAR